MLNPLKILENTDIHTIIILKRRRIVVDILDIFDCNACKNMSLYIKYWPIMCFRIMSMIKYFNVVIKGTTTSQQEDYIIELCQICMKAISEYYRNCNHPICSEYLITHIDFK